MVAQMKSHDSMISRINEGRLVQAVTPRLMVACLSLLAGALAQSTAQALVLGSGFQSEILASTVNDGSFTQYEGVSFADSVLYFGNFRTVQSYDLSTGTLSTFGSLPGNNGISHVTAWNGTVYASHFSSFGAPFPYMMEAVTDSGTSQVLEMDGIFDATVSTSGGFYFVANPDLNNDSTGDGTRLYSLDGTTGSATEIAFLGGASGGIAFNASGDLFYADYDGDNILQFTAAQLGMGGLGAGDALVAFGLENPGYLSFDSFGNLIASTLDESDFSNTIARYNPTTGEQIDVVATGARIFTYADGTTYVIEQSWDFLGDYGSTLHAVTIIPEPGSVVLFATACGVAVVWWRRRR